MQNYKLECLIRYSFNQQESNIKWWLISTEEVDCFIPSPPIVILVMTSCLA